MRQKNYDAETYIFEFTTVLKTYMTTGRVNNRRPRKAVYQEDIKSNIISQSMRELIALKNDAGWSWEMIARAITTDTIDISSALARKAALGECKSDKVDAALGLIEQQVTVPLSLVRIRPRSKTPRGKRKRLNIEDPTGELTAIYDDICATEQMDRTQMLRLFILNHLEYHGTRDYAELEY